MEFTKKVNMEKKNYQTSLSTTFILLPAIVFAGGQAPIGFAMNVVFFIVLLSCAVLLGLSITLALKLLKIKHSVKIIWFSLLAVTIFTWLLFKHNSPFEKLKRSILYSGNSEIYFTSENNFQNDKINYFTTHFSVGC